MTPERWRQVNDLFHAAAERDADGQRQLLEHTAISDPELAAEVRSLLAMHKSAADEFLEKPAWAVAPTLAFDGDTPARIGQMAGPYRIIREIGRGGMGVVYEAEDTRLRRSVALKALPSEYSRDPMRRERLTREARAAAALTHPVIATIYALDEIDGELYLVSELVRGQTLRDELARGALPTNRLLPTLTDLASGLAAAHAGGIVHRDFKPENIIRCADGRVKILDFGLARMEFSETRLTQTGMAVGTPGYMPPEQLSGQSVDARTDVFAFGVVAWELATGAHPFGATPAELLARMTDLLDGRTVTVAAATLPIAGLETILRRCLRRNPGERYRSAEHVLADLERLRATATPIPGSAPQLSSSPAPQLPNSQLPSSPQLASSPADHSLWWWQFHQAIVAVVIASMPVAAWFVRLWDQWKGSRIFLAVLALATIAVTIRLNLLFTSRVNRAHLAAHRARVFRTTAIIEGLLGFVLLVSAAMVTGGHDGLAAVLVTLAVATVASLGIVEPVTTSAAGIGAENQHSTPTPHV